MKNKAFMTVERECPSAINGAVECNGGTVIPLIDINSQEGARALDIIAAMAGRWGRPSLAGVRRGL